MISQVYVNQKSKVSKLIKLIDSYASYLVTALYSRLVEKKIIQLKKHT